MAKKKARRPKRTATPRLSHPKPPPAKPPVVRLEEEIKNAHAEAFVLAKEEGLSRSEGGGEPKPDRIDPKDLWDQVREARDLFSQARHRYESRTSDLDARAADLDKREQQIIAREGQLDLRESDLGKECTALNELDRKISQREREVGRREEDVEQREVEADKGFLALRRKRLEGLQKEVDEALEAQNKRMVEATSANAAEYAQLAKKRSDLEQRARRLSFAEADIREQREDLDTRVEQRVAKEVERWEHHAKSLKEQLEQARADRDRHERDLRERRDAARKIGQRTPDQVARQIKELQDENQRLSAELAERPNADAATRLADLEREREAWQAERNDLRRRESEWRQRYDRPTSTRPSERPNAT